MGRMDVWCRLEVGKGGVVRVQVMHPSGEILASFPSGHFGEALVGRIRAGQIRARLLPLDGGAARLLVLAEPSGNVVFEERIP